MVFTKLNKERLIEQIGNVAPTEDEFWKKVLNIYHNVYDVVYPFVIKPRYDVYDDNIVIHKDACGRINMRQHSMALDSIRCSYAKAFPDAWHHIFEFVVATTTETLSVSQAEELILMIELLLETAGMTHNN